MVSYKMISPLLNVNFILSSRDEVSLLVGDYRWWAALCTKMKMWECLIIHTKMNKVEAIAECLNSSMVELLSQEDAMLQAAPIVETSLRRITLGQFS
jgi:hypothetical protein